MKRTKKVKAVAGVLPKMEPQKFSLDDNTIMYLMAMQYNIRKAIEDRMVEISADPKCMPIATAKKVVKEFGLQKYDTF